MPPEFSDAPGAIIPDFHPRPDPSSNRAVADPLALSSVRRVCESVWFVGFARFCAAAFVLVTGTFFLLSSFTFSWLNIVKNDNVLWIAKLVHSYTLLYWLVLILNGATLLRAFSDRLSRLLTEAFLGVLSLIGLLLTFVYRLSDLPLSSMNLLWMFVVALPLLCFGLHDLFFFAAPANSPPSRKTLPLSSAFLAGILLASWFCAIAAVRYHLFSGHSISILAIFAVTMLLHGFVFTAFAAAVALLSRAMDESGASSRIRWLFSLVLLWIFASLIFRKLVTPALSFNSHWADLWSWTYPISFVVMVAGWHMRRSALKREALPVRVEEALSAVLPDSRWATAVLLCGALAAAVIVPLSIEQVDWNFLFQRLTAIAVWLVAIVFIWRRSARPAPPKLSIPPNAAVLLASIVLCLTLAQSGRLWRRWHLKSLSQTNAAYNGMDPSFQVAQIAFQPVVRDDDTTGLIPFLRKNALIADPIFPPSLRLIEAISPATGPKPDIYIIVVDTLRRDYVSAYNSRVTFTPRIGAFAKESVVFQRAYTNYGGTALSEPAIWAGAMIPSKYYVQPFSEMNALEQLTNADGYRRRLTLDRILEQILRASPSDKLLNLEGRQYFGLDIRDTVRELNNEPDLPGAGPLFVYTQPQNLHPVTLREVAHSGEKVQGSYPGFNARYADELRKVDDAFGQLISGLKARGKYENSIVILTSDHGDWLGEYGRWGHGQSLLPPIIEVPLLIHVPPTMAGRFYCNPAQPVFLTDLAPTLLYLLGHRALRQGEFYGRPLFTETAAEQKNYTQPYHLFMSSYAAVFALLEEQTGMFYVADAVDENQELFNLTEDHYGLENLIDRNSQRKYEQLTRGYINRLDALYNYSPPR